MYRDLVFDCAEHVFAEKGYADTGTPEIVAMAGVTRGALYHHFPDKLELFRAVVEGEAEAVAEQIASESMESDTALEAMLDGEVIYRDALHPTGLFGDGGVDVFYSAKIPAGTHDLSLRMNDSIQVDGFNHSFDQQVSIAPAQILLVGFQKNRGFVIDAAQDQ